MGSPVCIGSGSSFVANCISKPQGTAQIRYAVDGVCHQTANRILLPAMCRVDTARGYNVSRLFYGHYGYGQWQARYVLCYATAADFSEMTHYSDIDEQWSFPRKVLEMPADRFDSSKLEEMLRFAGEADGGDDVLAFRESCQNFLGHTLEPSLELHLANLQNYARAELRRLASFLTHGSISKSEYLERVNSLFVQIMIDNDEALGRTDFLKLYGPAGLEPQKLIDQNIFFEQHNITDTPKG